MGGTAGTSASGSAGAGRLSHGSGRLQRRRTGGSAAPERAARCRFLRAAATASTTRAAPRPATTATPTAGDGCNGACHVEPNWTCPRRGSVRARRRCGDGIIGRAARCATTATRPTATAATPTCTVQEPGYTCIPGMPSICTSICGDSASSRARPATTATRPPATAAARPASSSRAGSARRPARRACARRAAATASCNGDLGEECDDGNITEGDGCSSDCKIKGAGCSCVPGMKCVCPEVRCGNGTIEGTEKCDDGNADSGDGCSATCQVERGYVCPLIKAPCVPDCGDGILTGNEPCDPGDHRSSALACSAPCRWNPGWACTGSPATECHATKCGDSKKEGAEGCDDGNTMPFDGCSATCQNEPELHGHDRRLHGKLRRRHPAVGEACDDGNNLAGDGCSATCKVEPGSPACSRRSATASRCRSSTATSCSIARRLRAGRDRPERRSPGSCRRCWTPRASPIYVGVADSGYITSAATFAQWYRDVAGRQPHHRHDADAVEQRPRQLRQPLGPERRAVAGHPKALLLRQRRRAMLDAAGNPIPCTSRDSATTDCDMRRAGPDATVVHRRNGSYRDLPDRHARRDAGVLPGRRRHVHAPPAERGHRHHRRRPTTELAYAETGAPLHNFSFTSEVRYWFPYDASKTVHARVPGRRRRLGVHQQAAGGRSRRHPHGRCSSVTITIGQAASTHATFGLTNGNVYEVVVFQAERQKTSSSYQLTLSAGSTARRQRAARSAATAS